MSHAMICEVFPEKTLVQKGRRTIKKVWEPLH